ncbi:MAG: biotin carboxylase N-terminal domain-containing protein, partial [Mycobacterium leprae]
MRRLAIVNRGEAAMRALAAVAELNRAGTAARITTIAVHTDADAGAWFVREANEAVPLGPATYVDPTDGHRTSAYLDEERVVDLLRVARADAVWVGWGFVAESASFAQRCEDAGVVYVGPDAKTIHLLGDKVAAKRIAEQAEVPVLPWSGGPVDSAEEAAAAAQRIGGFPVLLKAAAGGGGRGIRIVRSPDELGPALASARSEAQLAFGDPSVFLEGFVPRARHVEVQIIADGHGTTWAVGVRDCSIQRRNQKVIEESASTLFDAAAEQWVKDAAVRLAQAVGYRNAGTVEFLVDGDGRVMFMEVNTRLQVEHPVTEATTGLDLVKLQLHVAGGGRLEGRTPRALGHAVEVRLNAEDPEQGFAPAPGRIVLWRPPAGPGIRVDSGITEGDVIAPEFDSMIAKIIAWGRDREEALARLRRALAQCAVVVEGGTTNRSFLLSLLNRPEVQEGRFDNRWLDRLTADGEHLPEPDSVAVLAAAVEGYDSDQSAAQAAFHAVAERGRPEAPEQVGHVIQLRYRGAAYRLSVFLTGPGSYRIDTGSGLVDAGVERLGDYERKLFVQGQAYRITAVTEGPTFLVDVDGTTHRVARDDGGVVRAMAPAFVSSVLVAPGDEVAAGDPLVVAESMKMETTITAPFAGTVA